MRQVSGSALLTVLFVVTSGSACSSRPDEQIKVAEKAMEQAKEQRAEEFAQSDWANAQQVWEQAQSQLKNERYGEAGTLLLRAKSRFEKARDIAKAKRDAVLKEAQELQKAVDNVELEAPPDLRIPMMISVGAAVFPHDGDSYESLLAKADSRMYRDKSQRKAARARLRSTEAMESAGYTAGGDLPHPAARAR